ncbi:MAG TPA: hypothetical protein PLV06_01815 [Bacteroidales bacterium]|nr:hypothetical protein [Bacteroidales bacterium]HPJ60591.1 hypothetical protein [Bacteroidales bacterium]HPR11097.1 hypothetical protein [Bacteroidales bacterium]HRW84802.1 hypothetical protein [Bacteroidales bacterium]
MKAQLSLVLIVTSVLIFSCSPGRDNNINDSGAGNYIDTTDATNNFYDNTEVFRLAVKDLTITGEIENPGKVDFSSLPVHSVIVKEALLEPSGSNRFTGAFRYDGYSLFDILNMCVIKKANAEEFNSIIDLYVEVENEKGEKAVFSWGEIYYANNLHRIIIASSVSRIVPSKTNELWTLPEHSKIVSASDLITERNIEDPVKITVRSYPESFTTVRGLSPMYSEKIMLYRQGEKAGEISSIPDNLKEITYNTIFYGRGRGIHTTSPFSGFMLKELLMQYYPVSNEVLARGIMCIAAADGYRSAVTYSELFNRNDQQEFLLVPYEKGEDGGLFRIFVAGDFFSDRAIKSVSSVHFIL